MGGTEDDKGDSERRSAERLFQHVKAQHDKLLSELQHETQRLEHEWSRENSNSSSAGPFSAFKNFVDDGLKSISHALKDLPTNTAELTSRMQREKDQWRAEEQDISRRWTGSTDSPDHVQMEQSRSTQREQEAIESAAELLDIAQELNAHVSPARVEALYRDDDSGVRILDMIGNLSSTPPEQPRWLSVDWFKRSLYSPVRLEGHHALGQHGAKWRAAFEELLEASLDKPMGSIERVGMRVPHGRPQSTFYGPGLEWMLSLQCRGILPMQLPRAYECSSASDIARLAVCPSAVLSAKNLLSAKALAATPSADSALAADFRDLVSAVGTKATANTEANPLPVRVCPTTEQELYESRYLFPAIKSAEGADGDAAGEPSGNVQTLTDESSAAKRGRLESALLRRGFELAGDEFEAFSVAQPPLEQLMEKVLALQEDHDNLERMTGLAWENTVPELTAEEVRKQEKLWALLRQDAAKIDHRMTHSNTLPTEHCQSLPPTGSGFVDSLGPPVARAPGVLSALTTTHTTRLPDGTVTTKVVLKQRFADGREETSESLHTQKEEQGRVQQKEQQEVEKPSHKRGWFWT